MAKNQNDTEKFSYFSDHVTFLPSPKTKSNDKKRYEVIKLKNGLTALLISEVTLDDEGNSNTKVIGEVSDYSVYEDSSNSRDDFDERSTTSDEVYYDCYDDDDDVDDDDYEHHHEHKHDTKSAAVGLCVGVGCFSDPSDIPGMAHFVEHMVFMGSKEYPNENEYDSFITDHGGCSNAHTDFGHTSFYFAIPNYLEEALKRFSQFFISPLMQRNTIQKEREVIDSEFQIARLDDENRYLQLLSSLAANNHPVKKFSWGNLASLSNLPDDELYDAAHKFHSRHYSAHRMTLVIQANSSIEKLISWVVKYFSNIPNNKLPSDDFSPYYDAVSFQNPDFTKLYRIKSVKEIYEVKVTWAVPSFIDHWKTKPQQYIASVLSFEGRNSLMSHFRRKVWALDIRTGTEEGDFENNPMYSLIRADLSLTAEGMDNLANVLEALFGYIRLMKEASSTEIEATFNETKLISQMSFEYGDEICSYENVELICADMQVYPSTDYFTGPVLYYDYDHDIIYKCLQYLTPERANIMVFAKDKNGSFDKTEPWFGTEYSVIDIPNEWLDMWKNVTPLPCFKLPAQNQFITNDFTLLPAPSNELSTVKKVHKDEKCEIWYCQDTKFHMPKAFYCYGLISPLVRESARNSALLGLYCRLLVYLIAQEAYPALEADLMYSIAPGVRGVEIIINGFNQKLRLLLSVIIQHIKNFEGELEETVFSAVKEEQKQKYYNYCIDPAKLCDDLQCSIVIRDHYTAKEKYEACFLINSEMIKKFSNDFLQQLYIQSLVQGNVTEYDARGACFDIIDLLDFKPLLINNLPGLTVYRIPKGELYHRVMSLNTSSSITYINNYYQSGESTLKDTCIIDFLLMFMEERLFNTLRTQEKLCYDVSCHLIDTYGSLGFSVTLNSDADKHSVDHVDDRIEAFMTSFFSFLKYTMSENEFKKARDVLAEEHDDINLDEEVTRNWHEIRNETYFFDRCQKEAELMITLERDQLIKWLENHVSCENLRKLSVQVVGNAEIENALKNEDCSKRKCTKRALKHSGSHRILRNRNGSASSKMTKRTDISLKIISSSEKKPTQYFVTDVKEFQENLELYPIHRILR